MSVRERHCPIPLTWIYRSVFHAGNLASVCCAKFQSSWQCWHYVVGSKPILYNYSLKHPCPVSSLKVKCANYVGCSQTSKLGKSYNDSLTRTPWLSEPLALDLQSTLHSSFCSSHVQGLGITLGLAEANVNLRIHFCQNVHRCKSNTIIPTFLWYYVMQIINKVRNKVFGNLKDLMKSLSVILNGSHILFRIFFM